MWIGAGTQVKREICNNIDLLGLLLQNSISDSNTESKELLFTYRKIELHREWRGRIGNVCNKKNPQYTNIWIPILLLYYITLLYFIWELSKCTKHFLSPKSVKSAITLEQTTWGQVPWKKSLIKMLVAVSCKNVVFPSIYSWWSVRSCIVMCSVYLQPHHSYVGFTEQGITAWTWKPLQHHATTVNCACACVSCVTVWTCLSVCK